MPIRPPRRWPASTTFSGSPAASRRPAASNRCGKFFPRIRKAYLIGEAADEFAATLGGGVPHEIAGTLDKALAAAARDAEASAAAEPVVLLSPACASFDQYRNFEVRGDAFRDLVRALPGLTPSAKCLNPLETIAVSPLGGDFSGTGSWPRARNRTPFSEWWWTVDRLTLAALGALMLGGIVLCLAASPPVAARIGLDPFHFVNRQVLFLIPAAARVDRDVVPVAARDPARWR